MCFFYKGLVILRWHVIFNVFFFVLKDKKYNLSNQYNFLQSVNNNQYKQT